MTQVQARTLLYTLLDAPELDSTSWPRFQVLWRHMATDAARDLNDPRLATVHISERTYWRWIAGGTIPRGNAATILESYFGMSADALVQPVPARVLVRPRALDRRTRTTARVLDYAWPTSRHVLGEPDAGIHDTWELDGGRMFDGTAVGVQFYEAEPSGDTVKIHEKDLAHLGSFVRSSRRGVVLASLGAAGGKGLYLMDAALAWQRHTSGDAPCIPLAFEVDDVVYALVWAHSVLNDGLLADDHPLSGRADELEHWVKISNSSPPRSDMPDLSSTAAAWLGSSLCARYIVRHLGGLSDVPVFWTREATGEECAPWLFFRHKHDYLQAVASRFGGQPDSLGRAFCIPEAAVRSTERYERILLLLTVAMMEMYGITVWVSGAPEYAQTEGFVLARDQAILANWVREEAVWRVSTTSVRRDIASYEEAMGHARAHSLIAGPTPADRLQALAEYLGLDWAWFTGRCRAIAREGISSMLRPRSRLLTLTALDRTMRFLGTVGSQQTGR